MFNIVSNFKNNPTLRYSLAICATWAGAGSLIVGINMVQMFGVIPFLIWAFGNIMACILFGLLANRFEYLRKVFTSTPAKLIIGFMCIFQLWVNMSGVHDALVVIDPTVATIITFVVAGLFLFLFLKFGMLRNIITDSSGWKFVYLLIIVLAVVSIIINGINVPDIGLTTEGISDGVHRMIGLLPGAFFYPCFWALFSYNLTNENGVKPVNMRNCFIFGSLFFGLYLGFVFVLGITSFTPELEIVKGILISLVAISSLTSFIFSIYLSFGNKIGFVVNLAGIVGWAFLIPLGVMTVWTIMADSRLTAVLVGIGIAIAWWAYDKYKERKELTSCSDDE